MFTQPLGTTFQVSLYPPLISTSTLIPYRRAQRPRPPPSLLSVLHARGRGLIRGRRRGLERTIVWVAESREPAMKKNWPT